MKAAPEEKFAVDVGALVNTKLGPLASELSKWMRSKNLKAWEVIALLRLTRNIGAALHDMDAFDLATLEEAIDLVCPAEIAHASAQVTP